MLLVGIIECQGCILEGSVHELYDLVIVDTQYISFRSLSNLGDEFAIRFSDITLQRHECLASRIRKLDLLEKWSVDFRILDGCKNVGLNRFRIDSLERGLESAF